MGCAVSKKRQEKKEEPAPVEKKKLPPSSAWSPIIVPPTPFEPSQSTAVTEEEEEEEEVGEEEVAEKEQEEEEEGQQPPEMKRVILEPEREWVMQKLDEWRNDLEKSAPPPSRLEWPTVRILKSGGRDKMSPLMWSGDGDKIHLPALDPVKDKEGFAKWIEEDKKRRKRMVVIALSDDTVYEVPTRMPEVNFSGYYSN